MLRAGVPYESIVLCNRQLTHDSQLVTPTTSHIKLSIYSESHLPNRWPTDDVHESWSMSGMKGSTVEFSP